MNNLLSGIFRWLFRAVLLLAGLVFFACLLVAATLLFSVWLVRALWARLTGRPVSPWVFRVDPRAQWSRFTQPPAQLPKQPPVQGRAGQRGAEDVIDVVPREIRPAEKPADRAG